MSENIEGCLSNFIRHVEDLRSENDPAGTGFHREFRLLREIQVQNKNEDRFAMEDGKTDENMKKNRYRDILPRDDRRVMLTPIEGEEGSDYINATFIQDVDGGNGYIAAQGPMPHTVNDFWRMLWEYNTEIVFMACRTAEGGKPKCEKYWADKGKSATFGNITVHNDHEEVVQEHFIRRDLRATKEGETHALTQFQYEGWPDHDTPSSPDTLRCMIESVRTHRKLMHIPMVIHCSAGCGRTGTICAIDYAWTLLDKGRIDSGFSLFEIIKSLREQRLSMVQTPDQYEYSYMVLKSLCEEWLELERKHDYENMVIGAHVADVGEEYCNVNFGQDSTEKKDGDIYGNLDPQGSVDRSAVRLRIRSDDTDRRADLEVVKLKRLSGNVKVGPTSIRNITSIAPRPGAADDGSGVYVKVDTAAIIEQKPLSPISPPALPDKKNPPGGRADLDKMEPHKTVITFGGGGNTTKVVKTGSLGFSFNKTPTPRPTAVTVISKPDSTAQPAGATPSNGHYPAHATNSGADGIYSSVEKTQTHTVPMHLYENQLINLENSSSRDPQTPIEDAPAVPKRFYKPEEINSTSSAKPSHAYDNVVLPGPMQHKGVTQPIPTLPPAQSSARPGMPGAPAQSNHPVHPTRAAHTAVVASNSMPVAPARHVSGKGVVKMAPPAQYPQPMAVYASQVQQVVLPAPGGVRTQMVHPNDRLHFNPQRLKRVKGPRPMPATWSKGKVKSHQPTYL